MVAVSIIVPVYNVEKYLKKCLDSILNQTLKNIEIIIVNDGSKDNSQEIIDKYKNDKRIISVVKENGGVSDAKNYGIKVATGEYLLFIDSDDYIENSMAEDMYKKAKSEKLDIVCSKFNFINEKTKKQKIQSGKFPKKILSNNELLSELLLGNISFHICNKMFKKSLFVDNGIYFPVGQIYEDQPAMLKLAINSYRTACIDKCYYYYLLREKSITTQRSLNAIENHLSFIQEVEEKINLIDIDLSNEKNVFLIEQCYYSLKLIGTSELSIEFLIVLKKIKNKIKVVKIINKQISWKNKIKLLIIRRRIKKVT